MKFAPALLQATFLAGLLSWGVAAVGAGAVIESQPSTPGQGSATDGGGNNNDALLMLLEQNRNLQAEVQALRALVEEQGYEVRKLQRESLDRYTDTDSRLGSLERAMTGGASPTAVTTGVTAPVTIEEGAPLPPDATATVIGETEAAGVAVSGSPNVSPPIERTDTSQNTAIPQSTARVVASTATVAGAPATSSGNGIRPAIDPTVLSEQQLYQMAYDSAINSQFDQAIVAFDQYLGIYPAGRFTTNAHYWKGQAYLYLNQYEAAVAAYTIILEQYPDSPKIPDATYGLGVAYEGLGNTQRARQLFREIKSKYPNTGVANLADTRLLTLD